MSEVRNRRQTNKKTKENDKSRLNGVLPECEEFQLTTSNERLVQENIDNELLSIGEIGKNESVAEISEINKIGGKIKLNGHGAKFSELNEVNKSLSNHSGNSFIVSIELDLLSFVLFIIAFSTRIYRLAEPNNVVFDELHYGKYVSLYMKGIFYFDQHPPLGKQIIAAVANFVNYNGNYTFAKIGTSYTENVPIFWLRFVPAFCGSLLASCIYKLLLQVRLHRWTAFLGGLLIIFDNALLTQSRFILMESMLLTFSTLAILFLLRCNESKSSRFSRSFNAILSAIFCTLAFSIKFVGFYTGCLCFVTSCRYIWNLLPDKRITDLQLIGQILCRAIIFIVVPITVYLGIFYYHLNVLQKAGPHDSIMTSAFQASLEGGLASITKGQPLKVVHGSQITLRHTLGRTCWLHSHVNVYPVRYPDKRGSSHQQQVTCYSFKDVNNWWIVKRPEKMDLVVGDDMDPIRHGEEIHLVHGITSRALNSHDVAAPVTPHCQEVSCYIDYNVSMSGQLIWKVDIMNRDQDGPIWHAITSQVRLIHVATGAALRFSGRQLPEWGYNQHEVVADRIVEQPDTIWNVEEHRYTRTEDQKERERQLIDAEMIPTGPTILSFWDKFLELQKKMFWYTEQLQSHMYSSEPLEWPLMSKGIAYWIDKDSNGQIHLIGNIVIWYSGTAAITIYSGLFAFYVLRRRRLYFDLSESDWLQFRNAGELFLVGYLIHLLPYFFVERTLFLHNYFPALIYKILLLCFVIQHIYTILDQIVKIPLLIFVYRICVILWIVGVLYVFGKFSVLSYGTTKLTSQDVIELKWKETWDLILHKDLV